MPDVAEQDRVATRSAIGLALGGACALAAGLGLGRFVYTPILPAMAEQLGLGKAASGLIASANFAGYLAGTLAAAMPRLPGRRLDWLRWNLALVALSLLAMAAAPGMASFLALRFLAGFASAFVLVIGSALVLGGLAQAGRPRLAALHFTGLGGGIVVTALLIPALHEAGVGWRGEWLAAGAVAASALVPVLALVRDREGAEAAPGGVVPGGAASALPGVVGFTLAYGLCGLGYSVLATFIVAMARAMPEGHRLEMLSWLTVGLAAMPSIWLWGLAARRLGVRQTMAAASLLQAVGTSACVLWPNPAGVLLSAFFLGGTFVAITAMGFAVTQRLAPEPRRRVSAAISAAFAAGQIAGPLLAGVIADRTQSFAAPTLLAAAASVIAAAILFTQRRAD